MSRIILSRYDDGEDHIVVGWDNPLQTFYWQIFNALPPAGDDGAPDWESHPDWEEMLGYAGYGPGEIRTVQDLVMGSPEHVSALITQDVVTLLTQHHELGYPESNVVVDMSKEKQ